MVLLVITPSSVGEKEIGVAQRLLEYGLHHLLLRLPSSPRSEYEAFIEGISVEYRERIIISDYYELLDVYPLGGIYIPAHKKISRIPKLSTEQLLLTAIHKKDELHKLRLMKRKPDFVLLSPVFDSISKEGYMGRYEAEDMASILLESEFPLIALGGITPERYSICASMGFAGVAVLGDVWQHQGEELSRYLAYPQSKVVSVAGHDASGGAGITSDARVAESFGVRAITVPSMWTIQSDDKFVSAEPLDMEVIYRNIELNLGDNTIKVAKIGMMPSISSLEQVVNKLRSMGVLSIVWDPLIWVSANNRQILEPTREHLESLLRKLTLITPNRPECDAWFGGQSPELLQGICDRTGCSILLKGGHSHGTLSEDILYMPHTASHTFMVPRTGFAKHGTGCMLSSAIASLLALGCTLPYACHYAQSFVHRVMSSSTELFPRLRVFRSLSTKDKLKEAYHLQYITNTIDPDRLYSMCQAYLHAGGRWIQLRAKNATTEERINLAKPLIELCHRYNAIFIINDDVEATLRSDADGVHLGKEDCSIIEARRRLGWHKIIGATCNTKADIHRAYCAGSDYVGVGPYRHTTTKKRLSPILGLEGLRDLSATMHTFAYSIPLVAIGGIAEDDVAEIMTSGVSGIALSGAIERATNITDTTATFLKLIKQ